MIGKEIGGYRILEQIGMGGMAKVFKAYQPSMERLVALKVLPDHYAKDDTFIQRFDQEARIIANLENRNILPVFDYGEDKGTTFLAMRYLRGGTLSDVMRKASGHKFSLNDAVHIISQIANALDYSHSQGIIHRDIKPSNILIDENGDCYLTDFGIAKVLDATSHLTSAGSALGTPAYMSPEQASGKEVNRRTDIYSLGIILYQLVVGRVPYETDTPMATMLAHINEPLPLPSLIEPEIHQGVERIILKALAKNPDDRYAGAGELADALKHTLQNETLSGETITPSTDLVELSYSLAQTKPNDEVTHDDIALARSEQRKKNIRKFTPAAVVVVFLGMLVVISMLVVRSQQLSNQVSADLNGLAESTLPPDSINLSETPTANPAVIIELSPTPENTPTTEPTLIPRKDHLLFILNRAYPNVGVLCVIEVDGSNMRCFNEDADFGVTAADWSPDGSEILFAANYEGKGDYIYRMDANFENIRCVNCETDLERVIWEIHWSPTGERLAVLYILEGYTIPYEIDIDGTNISDPYRTEYFQNRPSLHYGITWSYDGQYLNGDVPDGTFPPDIEVEIFSGNETFENRQYVISPDGKYILAQLDTPDPIVGIPLYNIETQEFSMLYDGPGSEKDPMWSPNSKYIAYISHAMDIYGDLAFLSLNNPNSAQVLNSPGIDMLHIWGNDSENIYFLRKKNEITDLYVLNIQTFRITQLTDLDGEVCCHVVQPDE